MKVTATTHHIVHYTVVEARTMLCYELNADYIKVIMRWTYRFLQAELFVVTRKIESSRKSYQMQMIRTQLNLEHLYETEHYIHNSIDTQT